MVLRGREASLLWGIVAPTGHRCAVGHNIRGHVSSDRPKFDANPNTGGILRREQSYRTATQTIYHSAEMSSHFVLPVQT